VDPHRVGLEGHGDQQLLVSLKISKKKCQNAERILEDPHLTELWDLGDDQIRPALKRGEKVTKW
jgi:hypothetical protein